MHARTRISICRGAFIALCIVPTLLTCAFIAFHWLTLRSPAAKSEWERELSQRLGVTVAIRTVAYPQPGLAELSGVRLTDPETGLLLAECRRVEVQQVESLWQVTLGEPTIERSALAALLAMVHDRILAGGADGRPPIRVVAPQLVIHDAASRQSLVAVEASFQADDATSKATLRFELPHGDSQPITLRAARNRHVTPPVTRIDWDSPAPMPADLAAAMLPELSALGPQAILSGSVRAVQSGGSTSGQFAGQIDGIDLSRLVSEQFPHVLSSQASLALDEARWDSGRLVQARGTLSAGSGQISRSLLSAAQEHLQLAAHLPPGNADRIAFDRLELSFQLDGNQLRIAPASESDEGPLLTHAGKPLLIVPAKHQAPAVALVRMLVPDSRVQVPATQQTAALLRLLPLPAVDPPGNSPRLGHTPTRLAPASAETRQGETIREKLR